MNKQYFSLKQKFPSADAIVISGDAKQTMKVQNVLLFEELPTEGLKMKFFGLERFEDVPLYDNEKHKRYIEIVANDNIEKNQKFAFAVIYKNVVLYFPSVCRDKDGDLEIKEKVVKSNDWEKECDMCFLEKDYFLSHYAK